MFERLKNKTILIVEDERVIRTNLASMLEILFKKVYTASNGEEGFDLFEQHLPDIILTDLKMHQMDGYAMLNEISKKKYHVYTIILSAYANTELLINAIHTNVDRYIIKPATEEELFSAFKAYFAKIDKQITPVIQLSLHTQLELEKNRVIKNRQTIHLNKKEVFLLQLLLKDRQKAFSYEEIQNNVWGSDIMTDSAIRSVVRDLRKKLGKKYIKNVSGIGYRFE